MERGNFNKASAILCGDIHLREDTPVCRTDNYEEAMWRKMDFISELQKKHGCPVYHSGDLYNHWKPSPYLLAKTIQHLPNSFITCLGNHDLPQHSLDLIEKCGVNVLKEAGVLVIAGTHFGQVPKERTAVFSDRKMLIWHVMAYQVPPFPGATGGNAKHLLQKHPEYDIICTGDNHQTFVEEYQGRLLVNPGSMMRMTAAQADHKPCVFLWYAETNTVQQVFLPIEEGVISAGNISTRKRKGTKDLRHLSVN